MLKLEQLRNLKFINTMFKSSPLISEVTLAGVARFQPHFSLIPIAILSAVGTVLCYPDESDKSLHTCFFNICILSCLREIVQ